MAKKEFQSPEPSMKAFRLTAAVVILSMFCTGASAIAGGALNGGGGGGAILCLNPDNSVKSAELVDLVESSYFDNLQVSEELSRLPWKRQVEEVVNRISFVDPQFNAELRTSVENIFESFLGKALTRESDTVFAAPQDLSHSRLPPIRVGCQLVGAAVRDDGNEENPLSISRFIWNALSNSHKAALILHEAIYFHQRTLHTRLGIEPVNDSAATRKLVGLLFSGLLKKHSETDGERKKFRENVNKPYTTWNEANYPIETYTSSLPNISRIAAPFLERNVSELDMNYFDSKICEGKEVTLESRPFWQVGGIEVRCNAVRIQVSKFKKKYTVNVKKLTPISRKSKSGTTFFKVELDGNFDLMHTCQSSGGHPWKNTNYSKYRLSCGNKILEYEDDFWRKPDLKIVSRVKFLFKQDFVDTFLVDFKLTDDENAEEAH